MRVFLYEYITGGGTLHDAAAPAPAGSLLAEGLAMITALASDFARLSDVTPVVMRDARLPRLAVDRLESHDVDSPQADYDLFLRLAAACDAAVIIAPELDDVLLGRVCAAEHAGAALLSPGADLVRLAADKHDTAEHLRARGVPAPRGVGIASGQPAPADFPLPAVRKPRRGAGSVDVKLVTEQPSDTDPWLTTEPLRLEEYLPGMAVSVAVLRGPRQACILPACAQRLTADGAFHYQGGALPLPAELAGRAHRLALSVVAALPVWCGYLGIDLVLGPAADGSRDAVIEINPRLSTSYVGLQALAECNLAGAMLSLAAGEPVELSFAQDAIEFDADGLVRRAARR